MSNVMTPIHTTSEQGREVEATVKTYLFDSRGRCTGFRGHLSVSPNMYDKEFEGYESTGEHSLRGDFAVSQDEYGEPTLEDRYEFSLED